MVHSRPNSMSCTCHFCVSPCVQWHTSATAVTLPIAIRFTDDVLGFSTWAWLVNFDGTDLWIKCMAMIDGSYGPRTFSNALDAAHAVCGDIRCSPPQGVTEAEKMWHFKTQEGFRSIRSLRSDNVSVVVSSANTNGLNSTTMNCRGNMSSYVSVHQPNDPSQPEPCGLLALGNKRKRVSASSKRKQQQCEQAPPPTSPVVKNPKKPPYDLAILGGNKDVQTIAAEAKMPWSTETITELLTNGAKVPLIKVSTVLQGRYGFVECSFTLPDGTVVHNVWIHINLLSFKYMDRIKHLL